MMNLIANAHICQSNDLIRAALLLIRSVAELSPDAIKRLEDSRSNLQGLRVRHFSSLLLMTKLVALGVILEGPELVYELWNVVRRWRRKAVADHAPSWITFIGMVGWILVSVGVAGEFWVDGKVNSDDDNIQSINIQLLRDASSSAGSAARAAYDAQRSSIRATKEANRAETSSFNAITLARSARSEADSFERDIVSAKTQAADAESDLADARKQAASALEQLHRIKSPRALINSDELVSKLRAFKGTKYTLSVFQEDESIQFAKAINRALHDAGWDRIPTPARLGAPQLLIPDLDTQDGIPVCFDTGVHVHLRMNESLYMLNASKYKPQIVGTAGALDSALALAIFPPDDGNVAKQINLDDDKTEGEQPMNICIGKKP